MPRQYEMTKQGKERLEMRLMGLRERRGQVGDQLREAAALGDLSENADYDEAKYQQGIVEGQIAEVEIMLANCAIVEAPSGGVESVALFTTVTVLDLEHEDEFEYTIVPAVEADYRNGLISAETPLGEGLMGRREGDEVEIETPGGKTRLRVLLLRPRDAQ